MTTIVEETQFLEVKNRVTSKLAASLTSGAGSLTVTLADAGDFPDVYPYHLTIEDEVVAVTNRVSNTLTITRAQQDTSAAAHPNKAHVFLNITAKSVADLNAAVNTIEQALEQGINNIVINGTADYPLSLFGATANVADVRLVNGALIDNTVAGTLKLETTAAGYVSISEGQIIAKCDYLDLDLDIALRFIGAGVNIDGNVVFRDNVTIGRSGAPVAHLVYGNITISGANLIMSAGDIREVDSIFGSTASLPVRIGDAGTSSHSLASEDDLMVSGKLEVKGLSYFDSDINIAGNKIRTTNNILKEEISSWFALKNAADDAYINLKLSYLQWGHDGGLLIAGVSGAPFSAANSNDAFVSIQAFVTDGALTEIARMSGAADPLFSIGGSQEFKFYSSGVATFGGTVSLASGGIIDSSGSILLKPSGDNDDFFTLATVSNVPTIYGTGAYLRIGDANTTSHSLNSEDDLMVSGELEVDGAAFLDAAVTVGGPLRGATSLWWREHHYSIFSISPGASGATETAPDANTLGGFQLDVNTELLFFNCHVHPDWSADSDVEVHIHFEVNVDNTGGSVGDTVDLQLIVRMKGEGDTAIKTQTLENAVVVDQSAQYKAFETIFVIDFDSGTDPVDSGDLIALTLNLETDTSEVDDVIINHVMCRYKTKKVANEV